MNVLNARNTAIAAAVAAALGGVGTANAQLANPGNNVFYMAGGSAEPQPVQSAVCQILDNVDSVTNVTGAISPTNLNPSSYLILEGQAKNNIGSGANEITAGTEVMIMYKFNGGSYLNGAQDFGAGGGSLTFPTVASVIAGTAIAKAAGGTTTTGGAQSACTAGFGGPTFQATGYTMTNLQQPQLGITDLNVGAFSGDNNPNGPTAALVTPTSPNPGYDLVEGVAVNANLFAIKSNFTSEEVALILSGGITDWHDITGNNGQPVAAAGTPIVLLDRNVGSGTKTAGSAYFLGYPWKGSFQEVPGSVTYNYTGLCGAGSTFSVTANASPPATCGYGDQGKNGASGPFPGSAAGAGAAGYQDVDLSNSATVVSDLQTCNATADVYCIAILSADNAPYLSQAVAGTNAYDFVSVDGTYVDTNTAGSDSLNDPSGAGSKFDNVINGSYKFYYQVSVQTLTGGVGYVGGSTNAEIEALLEPLLTGSASSIAGITQKAKFPVASPSIVLDPDLLGAATASPTAGTVLETRGGNADNTLSIPQDLYGATFTYNTDPL